MIQEVFLNIWKYCCPPKIPDSDKAYLYTALRREILKVKAKEGRKTELEQTYREDKEEQPPNVWSLLANYFQVLSSRQRDAIHLKFYENMDNQVIADLMEIDIKGGYKLISTGLKKCEKNNWYWVPSSSGCPPAASL